MRTYLIEVAGNGRLELIDELARPDMIDEANQAFGGPRAATGCRPTSSASGGT